MKCTTNYGNEIRCHVCGVVVQHDKEENVICIEKPYVCDNYNYPPTCNECVKKMYAHVVQEEADEKVDELLGHKVGQ